MTTVSVRALEVVNYTRKREQLRLQPKKEKEDQRKQKPRQTGQADRQMDRDRPTDRKDV